MSAVAYIRVSTDEQAREGVSLAAQEERIRAYCAMSGLPLRHLIREEAASGGTPLSERPAGKELLRRIQELRAGHVVALKLDRLFRDAEDALRQTRVWDRAGVALHLVDMGGSTMNTASAMGRMFLTMTAAFAELERSLIAERTATALAHKKRCGAVYSPTPYGFDREGAALRANEHEQSIIRDMQMRRQSGLSFRRIADELNAAGVASKNGRRWYAATVRYILANSAMLAVG